jgi:hypothetical protein
MLTFLNRAASQPDNINDDLMVSLCGLAGDLYQQFGLEDETVAECEGARRLLERAATSPTARVRVVSGWAARLRDSGEHGRPKKPFFPARISHSYRKT